MECTQLQDRPLLCQILSIARVSMHEKHLIDNGTLLKEENGIIAATGREQDPYTVFFIHKFTIDKKLAYKIQSVEDKTYMAIDEEFENLIMKSNPEDNSTSFWVKEVRSNYRVFQSVIGINCYLRVEPDGTIIPTKIDDEEDIKEDSKTWFVVNEVN